MKKLVVMAKRELICRMNAIIEASKPVSTMDEVGGAANAKVNEQFRVTSLSLSLEKKKETTQVFVDFEAVGYECSNPWFGYEFPQRGGLRLTICKDFQYVNRTFRKILEEIFKKVPDYVHNDLSFDEEGFTKSIPSSNEDISKFVANIKKLL